MKLYDTKKIHEEKIQAQKKKDADCKIKLNT